MADQTVNIATPVLQGAEKFKARYRTLPSGIFTSYVDYFTNSFTITGLATGDYEIEIVFVTEGGISCTPVYQYFQIIPDFNCWDFLATQIESPANSGLYYIRLDFSGGTQPPCGWNITITPLNGSPVNLTYPTLPSTTINIPVQNVINSVFVQANLCNGKTKDCFAGNTTPVPGPPACIPGFLNSVEIIYVANQPWGLAIDFAQSSPATIDADVTWQQIGTPRIPGTPMDSGVFQQANYPFGGNAANQTLLIFVLNPTNIAAGQFTYRVRIKDRCNKWHEMTVAFG